MTYVQRQFKNNDVVIYMVNYADEGELGFFTHEMDHNLDLTYIHLLTHNGKSVDMNAIRSGFWRVSNIWKTGYLKSGIHNLNQNRRTKFLVPLIYSELDNSEIMRIARQELKGNITFIY